VEDIAARVLRKSRRCLNPAAAFPCGLHLGGPFLSPDLCHHPFVFSNLWENRRGDRYSEVVQRDIGAAVAANLTGEFRLEVG
jgi:hypothetical protein